MNLLSQVDVHGTQGTASIQLLQGDLSAIPPDHATDILLMSAFPGDYTALPGSLILALQQKGLHIGDLAADKDTDLLAQLNCWLSKPLSEPDQQKFNFKRVLCFEPGDKIKEPRETVGDIFRCINTFVFNDDHNVLTMPIIGTGYQKVPVQKMLPAMLEASHFWLRNGLPLDCIQIVVHRDELAKQALEIFNQFKTDITLHVQPSPAHQTAPAPRPVVVPQTNLWKKIKRKMIKPAPVTTVEPPTEVPPAPAPAKTGYDYFLSYAHVHAKEVQHFVDELKTKNSNLQVFYDKDSIPPGGMWIQQISAAIQKADKVLVFLSPEYDNSPVCWDEFQCAKLMEYNRKKNIIQTVYLYGHKQTEMPLIMGIYSYIDCREGSTDKISAAVQQLLK